jgi:hypothetical protein
MGVYDFNISEYNIDSIIAVLRKELQNIVINSQTNINEIKRRIAEDEVLLNYLKNAVDSLPDYTSQYNELRDEINKLNLALNELIDHPIILDNIDVSGHSGIITEVQKINGQYIYANHAINDASGRNIVDTYATKDEIREDTSAIYDTITTVSGTLTDKINQEKEEREIIEDDLRNSILESVSAIYDTISTESTERKNVENDLYNTINEESHRAIEEENQIRQMITSASGDFSQEIAFLSGTINDESTARAENDSILQNNLETSAGILQSSLTDEIVRAMEEDFRISNELSAEINRAKNKEKELVNDISDLNDNLNDNVEILSAKIDNEITRAISAENELVDDISDLNEYVDIANNSLFDAISATSGNLNQKIDNVSDNLSSEINDVNNNLISVSSNLNTLINNNKENQDSINDYFSGTIDNLKTYVDLQDNYLSGSIDYVSANLITSANNIINYTDNLINITNKTLSSVSSTLNTAINYTAEQLSDDIDDLSDSLTDEITDRISADNTLQNNITALQGQIETIEATQNVIDLVGTYTDLQNYDTTNVKIHDKIQVITDSTHDNQSTIYSWENNSWSYVGMFGPYYTKSQVDEIHRTNNLTVSYNDEIVTLNIG